MRDREKFLDRLDLAYVGYYVKMLKGVGLPTLETSGFQSKHIQLSNPFANLYSLIQQYRSPLLVSIVL